MDFITEKHLTPLEWPAKLEVFKPFSFQMLHPRMNIYSLFLRLITFQDWAAYWSSHWATCWPLDSCVARLSVLHYVVSLWPYSCWARSAGDRREVHSALCLFQMSSGHIRVRKVKAKTQTPADNIACEFYGQVDQCGSCLSLTSQKRPELK